ncbi:TetR/AcrR family transcriptional regulator C-terminal domain-containing protein [Cellulomonas fengjieae]|uniref:TetR/AcrR family transcriptional regulator C-terminal domain-containing protein n=1 Tax=Cellulomonas fengjieae TaxID=2819978 RepID=UPI001AAED5DC|nr:TetR/AcrR family transcriptional regulator C-terminal domain-containing protein [Cellulomonas fengjieae]MBO3101295.1 TetR/AcrR family transcriptional regulator C-terminal domain-containing protein [Cellulomonas fengjieae]
MEERSGLPRGVRQAWGRDATPGRPGPKAMLSIPGIAASATALADAEGAAALSLGRIAERLGVTPNALYRYVDSRDDLDVIVHDHALGAPTGIRAGEDWGDAAAAWCRALRDRYVRHPWLSDMRVRVPFAPNSLAWLENLLDRLEPSGLGERRALQAAGVLDGYVRSRAAAVRDLVRPGGTTDPGALVELVGADQLAARLPRVASLISSGLYREPQALADEDFEFGLASILTGLRQLADRPGH